MVIFYWIICLSDIKNIICILYEKNLQLNRWKCKFKILCYCSKQKSYAKMIKIFFSIWTSLFAHFESARIQNFHYFDALKFIPQLMITASIRVSSSSERKCGLLPPSRRREKFPTSPKSRLGVLRSPGTARSLSRLESR